MRLLALTIAALSLSTTASDRAASGRTPPSTSLTIVALNASVGRAVFHLRCDPAGGDVPSPAKACAALAEQPELVTNPRPSICRGGPGSHWLVRIRGPLKEQRVNLSFSTCWSMRMPTIEQFGLTSAVLRRHLVPRRHKSVAAGTTRRFPAGVLRPTDLVSCNILGHHLSVGVPVEPGQSVSVTYGGAYPSIFLTVSYSRDGSVTTSCHRWKRPKLRPPPSRSVLPEDVALTLPSSGIDVRDASEVTRATFPITGRRAVRIAWRNFHGMARPYASGWARVGRVTVHLVRVVRSNSVGPLGLFPDQLVWLVVIRDATIPNLGPPGPGPQSFNAMLGVFVRTDTPRFIVATTF
jgi:hypothetical protein